MTVQCHTLRSHGTSQCVDQAPAENRKLRSACDSCHGAKIRCSGGMPCARCKRDNIDCHYSYRAKLGKPKGSINKKTLERLKRMREAQETIERQPQQVPTPQDSGSFTSREEACSTPQNPNITTLSSAITPSATEPLARKSIEPTEPEGLPAFTQGSADYSHSIFPEETFFGLEEPTCDELGYLSPKQNDLQVPHIPGTDIQTQYLNLDSESSDSSEDGIEEELRKSLSPSLMDYYHATAIQHPPCDKANGPSQSSFQPSMIQQNETTLTTCICFHNLTEHLCQLQSISDLDHVGLDTLLIQSQRVLPTISCFLHCSFCCFNTQAFLLTSMLLSKIFALTGSSITPCQQPLPPLKIRLGNYNPSGQLATIIKCLLVKHHLRDLKVIVDLFDHKIGQLLGSEADSSYLKFQAQSFKHEVEKLSKQQGSLEAK